MENKAPLEGEIVGAERAADGGTVPHAANTLGEFVNMIEDGQFGADVNQKLADLAALMSDLAQATGNKQTGKVTLELTFTTEGGPFQLAAKFKVKEPEEKRRRTLLFTDERNHFTRTQPRQRQLFGIREVDESGPIRNA